MAPPQTQRRRQPLDRDEIVAAAVALSKEADLNALSFRRLGDRLGVDPTALYRHFPNKDELVMATLDAIWLEAAAMVPRSLPWRVRLVTGAHVFQRAIVEHPAVGTEAAHRSTLGPGERLAVDMIVECLEEAGLSDDDVVRLYAVFSGIVLSQASAQAAYLISATAIDHQLDRPWINDALSPDPSTHPALHRHRERLAALSHHDVFELSLELVLRAIEEAGDP